MASLCKDPKGRKRIIFVAEDGKRKTIRLGKTSIKQAESFKLKLEALIAGRFTGSIDPETARWIAGLPEGIHAKLAGVRLLTPRPPTINSTLGIFLDGYLQDRTDLKPNSQIVYSHTRRMLIGFFGPDKPLNEITLQDANLWREYLNEQGLAESTVNKRCGNAKVFFNVAKKRKLIAQNPFRELESKSIANKSRQYFLERKDADKILEACPDAEWKLLFNLCRYGGLRCPSEILALQWSDVNWQEGRLLIHSPKTERHEGRESRIIPIFPEIIPHLHAVFDSAKPGTSWVITRYRKTNVNLRTQLNRIIKRAGLKPWPRLFQNLRATRESELASQYPLHVATAWIGNTARIAERHYLQIPDTFYKQAILPDEATSKAARNAAQYDAAQSGNEQNDTNEQNSESVNLQSVAAPCNSMQRGRMETKGIEPSFPRCDRGVLPLHHVPEITFECVILQERFRNSTYFYADFGESSELPLIVANDFFYRLTFRLGFAAGRIAEGH